MSQTAEAALDALRSAVSVRKRAMLYRETHAREFAPPWYDWQLEFFNATRHHRQVMLLAANRVGKTFPGSYAFAIHVTGQYPDWWGGCVIHYPVTAWALGVDATQTRDVLQRALLGIEGQDGVWRGGWIHHEEIVDIERGNLPGAVSKVYVRHKSGGISVIDFKAYRQASTGQKSLPFAGSSVDVMLVDEQPPDEVMGQLRTRLMTGRKHRGGLLMLTLTPELGETELVAQFMGSRDLVKRAGRDSRRQLYLVGPIAWDRAAHLTPELREEMLADYPEHERDMRSKGLPFYGSGKIFSIDESMAVIPPFDISQRPWLRVLRSLDIGIDHPTAMAWIAFDPEAQTYILCKTFRQGDRSAAIHASTLNSMWRNSPLVVPPDIDSREKGSGETVKSHYEAGGITAPMLTFQNPDGSRYVEPGLFAMQEAFRTGRFLVFRDEAAHFLEEARSYHRDEKGAIVKRRDDVIDAVRYGFQMVATHGIQAAERERPLAAQGGLYPQMGLRRVR